MIIEFSMSTYMQEEEFEFPDDIAEEETEQRLNQWVDNNIHCDWERKE